VTEATGLAPRSCKRTTNRDTRDNSSGSSSSGDDENDERSEDADIMSPPNLSKRKSIYAYLQYDLRRVKASLSGAKDEVKQYKKQCDEAAQRVLILKTALDNDQETKDHWCVPAQLKSLISDIAGLKAILSKGQYTLNNLTRQFNTKSNEYDRLGLHLVVTTTKYCGALLELKATKEDIAKLSIDLIVARD
jgi:chromosome segregation ATPase